MHLSLALSVTMTRELALSVTMTRELALSVSPSLVGGKYGYHGPNAAERAGSEERVGAEATGGWSSPLT